MRVRSGRRRVFGVRTGVPADPVARIAHLRTALAFPIEFAAISAPDRDTAGAFRIGQDARTMPAPRRTNGARFDIDAPVAGAATCACAMKRGVEIMRIDEDPAARAAG